MRHGGGFRLLGALLVVGVVAALTAGAYSAGYVAGAGTSATNVSPWGYGGAFGAAGIVGLIVTVLILVVVFRVMRFAFWGHAHSDWDRHVPGGPGGPWGWRAEQWRSNRQAAFDEWHRRAHDEQPGQTPGGAGTGGTPTGGTRTGGVQS